MKKYLTMVLFALFAFCGVAFAQETGVSDPTAGDSGAWGYVLAAVIAVINAVLSLLPELEGRMVVQAT